MLFNFKNNSSFFILIIYMDKIINDIKQSCEDLKVKNIIKDSQYRECLHLTRSQKWRNELNNEKYTEKVNDILKKEMEKYNKYKKLIDVNIKKLKESYTLQKKNNITTYLNNLDNIESELKQIINDYQNKIYKKESYNMFRELIAKKNVNKDYSAKINSQKKELQFIEKKEANLTTEIKNNSNKFLYRIIALIFLIIVNILLVLYFKYYIINV